MTHLRLSALLLVTLLLTAGPLAGIARAAGPEALKAADYIVSTFGADAAAPYGEPGSAADSLLALVATGDPKYDADVAGILDFLKTGAADYVKPDAGGDSGAAKLALVAAATGESATDFGGVDLLAQITAGIGADGAFGAWPGPFASGLAMVALARNGQQVPEPMVTYLLTYQEPRDGAEGGGFGCSTYPFAKDGDCPAADPDSSALAVLGLQAAGTEAAVDAATDALGWLAATQTEDGSWQNYSPVNSTGMVGSLFVTGTAQATKAAEYVVSQQLDSGALTTGTDDEANLLATQQGIFALTGTTYLTLGRTASPDEQPGEQPATDEPLVATPSGTDPTVGWVAGGLLLVTLGAMGVASSRNRTS
ncbi:hypothetical protein [Micropruina sonneratiae]|uniref:hypothetical protein n=1 Tax=Micropruina sonneratiae TaxID=2986940 RepID=UPI002226842F|nr:hypothetical protein [Micropruina sp. KQZ13P-5]MCW3156907.1 hypothetical protein [Micropruina sp. KQZ13P-5]